jgi:hypothetical protein
MDQSPHGKRQGESRRSRERQSPHSPAPPTPTRTGEQSLDVAVGQRRIH